ncbi:Fic family protein [Chloroflexia bacterium SDU3-3]|nr:Fic family protein [Chloroflexia bacterium SDU3-3]
MTPEIRLDPRLAQRLHEKKALLDLQRPLSPTVVAKLYEDLRIRQTYHSNAIEGNTLDLSETQLVVAEGITIGGHTVREHLEAINHAAAYGRMLELARGDASLDAAAICELHGLVTQGLVDTPGAYRRAAVFISGSEHRPPHHSQVSGLMADLVAWVAGDGQAYEPVLRAALTHEMLLAIHPFADGNGRTGRLVLNLQLMRDGYPTALLLAGWRPRYIQAMERAHHGQYSPLANVIGQAVEAGLDMFLSACADVPEELQRPIREVAEACAIDGDYLGWLLREGRVAGQKRRGRWYTSEAAVRRYQREVAEGVVPKGRPRQDGV